MVARTLLPGQGGVQGDRLAGAGGSGESGQGLQALHATFQEFHRQELRSRENDIGHARLIVEICRTVLVIDANVHAPLEFEIRPDKLRPKGESRNRAENHVRQFVDAIRKTERR